VSEAPAWLGPALLACFLLHAGAHIALAVGIGRRGGIGRGALALVVAPLGIYWAFRARMNGRVYLWVVTFVAYGAVASALALGIVGPLAGP
jgi:hypothetical protein